MTDQKQNPTSGKPNKFNEQNKHSEERKAADNPRQGESVGTPETQKPERTETTETNKQK